MEDQEAGKLPPDCSYCLDAAKEFAGGKRIFTSWLYLCATRFPPLTSEVIGQKIQHPHSQSHVEFHILRKALYIERVICKGAPSSNIKVRHDNCSFFF